MSTGHARIAPSSLYLTVACTASVTMREKVPPRPDTEETLEGTAAHLVAMWAAEGKLLTAGERFTSQGREWTVTIDMHNGAKRYAGALGGRHSALRLEDAVRVSAIHPEHCYGTPDAWRMFMFDEWVKMIDAPVLAVYPPGSPITHVVRVGEYKYGHRFVEVFENWQEMAYGMGVLERLGLSDLTTLFEFVLVQPRAYHRDGPVRIWRVRASDLRAFVNIANGKAAEALGPRPVATTSEHCIDCDARATCATFRNSVANIIDYSGTPELTPLDATAMGQELRILDAALQRLEARREGLAVAVESTLRAGMNVPFYEMASGRSTLKWKPGVTPQEVADFGDLIGIDVRKPFDVMTPTQCVDAGVSEAAITEDYAQRTPAPLKLKACDPLQIRKALAGGT